MRIYCYPRRFSHQPQHQNIRQQSDGSRGAMEKQRPITNGVGSLSLCRRLRYCFSRQIEKNRLQAAANRHTPEQKINLTNFPNPTYPGVNASGNKKEGRGVRAEEYHRVEKKKKKKSKMYVWPWAVFAATRMRGPAPYWSSPSQHVPAVVRPESGGTLGASRVFIGF